MIPMCVRTPRFPLALAAATALLTGCGGGAAGGGSSGTTVVAGFYPLEWTAERIGGDRVSVASLTPPGAEPHDLELAPQDVGAIADADLVVYLAGFQPAIDQAAEAEAADRAWNAGTAADLTLPVTGGPGNEEHAGEEHADEEHADGAVDPHFWLDPLRLAAVGDALAERLAEADPEGTETYLDNAAALRTDLEQLDAELQDALGDCAVDTLVTSHDAFGYLGDRYGLEVIGVSGVSPSQEPEASAVAEISELVADRGVTTVYTETLVDPAVAETVAVEAGVRTAVLDPLEGLTDESAGADYLEVMRVNRATLAEGQSCA
jgi:zinc transport system substrate-binding protein